MRKLFLVAALAVGLAACSSAQVQTAQNDVTTVTAALNTACVAVQAAESAVGVVGALPAVNNIEAYANSACSVGQATSVIIGKAINDPSTVAWVENLANELQAFAPKA